MAKWWLAGCDFLFFSSDPENVTVQFRASWIPKLFSSNLPTSEAKERVCLRVGASFEESSQLIEGSLLVLALTKLIQLETRTRSMRR